MADAVVELAETVPAALALKLASSLAIDGKLSKALALLPENSPAATQLMDCHKLLGAGVLVSVLRGFAASAASQRRDIRPVWSGPTFHGDGDHTTGALAHLIDSATEDVFASTYSATPGSGFVKALWRAVARGVQTTLLVDSTVKNGETAAMLQSELEGASFWTFLPADGAYGIQHSKVVIVDSRSAMVTSANLSVAAAERNLEAGIVLHDPDFASKVRQRFQKLREAGAITDL